MRSLTCSFFSQTPFNLKTSSAGEKQTRAERRAKSPKWGFFSPAAEKRDWHPFATRRQVMCLVIEFLSDLINALAVSLSRRCHPHIFQKKKNPLIMHVSMPTRLCPHGGRQQLCTQYICTPTNPLKIPSFSSSYSSSPSHPSSATVVFIQSRVWRVIQLPSDSLQDHRWKQTWLALLFFFFFLMPSQFANSIPWRRFKRAPAL